MQVFEELKELFNISSYDVKLTNKGSNFNLVIINEDSKKYRIKFNVEFNSELEKFHAKDIMVTPLMQTAFKFTGGIAPSVEIDLTKIAGFQFVLKDLIEIKSKLLQLKSVSVFL